jgi:NAD(P)-dependent dehydrogenase (short-subunit alcohol dehydrogenase family)
MRTRSLFLLGAALVGVMGGRAMVRRRRRYELRGKVVVITGGSRGLGLVLARQLAEQGARIVICARDPIELRKADEELTARGADVTARLCDVRVRSDVETLINGVVKELGAIDVLINNAGTIVVGPEETMTRDDYEQAMKVHFWAALDAIRTAVPYMRARGGGRIVNISSIGGKISPPHLIPYNASKFALVGLSEGLRSELMKDNIYVTTVTPSLMRTGSTRHAIFKGKHRAEHAWFTIADATPGLSISVERAAARIIDALVHGSAEAVLSLPWRIAVAIHGLFPGLTSDVNAMLNALLPKPGGIWEEAREGKDSESRAAPSAFTILDERAALRNNET